MPFGIGQDAIEKQRVSIGWSRMGDLSKLPEDREVIKNAIATAYPENKQGAIPVYAGVIFRFIHEIKAGDYVVYPSKHDRMVNIGRFTGEFVFEPGDINDDFRYPNSRTVDWLGHFPRSDFNQSTLYEIGSFITLFSIQTHTAEFLAKIDQNISNAPETTSDDTPDDDSISNTATLQAEQATDDFIINRIQNRLTPYEFEQFIADLLECMGYNASVTQRSSDGGVDIIAHKDKLGFEPPIIKIQCKQTTNKISETQIRELLGTLVEGEYGLFVSLGSFDTKAQQSERNLAKLRLIGGKQLVELIKKHYSKLSPHYRTLIPLRQIYVPDLTNPRD